MAEKVLAEVLYGDPTQPQFREVDADLLRKFCFHLLDQSCRRHDLGISYELAKCNPTNEKGFLCMPAIWVDKLTE